MSVPFMVNSVRKYLSSNYMLVDEEWLSDCVSYLVENNLSENEIQVQAKEQWLLNNLTDICPGCLPPNIKNERKTVLPGRYVLQINAVEDIGTSSYQQLLKLKKVNIENIEATAKFEEKVPSHRMIKLYMTDGVQDIIGLEYKPMRNLSLNIIPGSKVLIKGPLECRNGMILLSESSVELLGGEVEEKAKANSQALLLSAKLGLPITQVSNLDTISLRNEVTSHAQTPILPSLPPPPSIQLPPQPHINNLQHQPPNLESSNFADDEIDIDQLDAIEAQISKTHSKRPSDDVVLNPEKKLKTNISSTIYDEEDFFEDEDYLRELEAKFDEANENELNASRNEVLNTVSSEPFVYIKQINDLNEIERIGMVFKVKAQIIKLLSKLRVSKDGWSLSCTIVDGTGCLDVDFSSDVLSNLVGFTPQEMTKMKKQMAQNPDIQQKVILALQKARDELQVLYCIMEIAIMEKAIIKSLIPYNSSHVDTMKKRLQDSGHR